LTMSGGSPWDRLWSLLEEVVVDDLDREVWRNLASHVDFRGRSVLELGCGRGLLSRFAVAAGARSATLVDQAPEALRIARGLLADVPGAEFVQGDVLGYEGGRRFDIVLSSGLVEHFEGERLASCLEVHGRHAGGVVAIVVPSTPHYNEVQCRTRRFVETFGYERPISARRMAGLMRAARLHPIVLRRFHPLYNLRAYWSIPRMGIGVIDRRLDRWYRKVDSWAQRHGTRDRLVPHLRRFDRLLGGLLLAIGKPEAGSHRGC
jgi:SAM-dependent methyltransferase